MSKLVGMGMPSKPSLDDITHHGVKGMHWGVRRDSVTGVRPIARTLNNSRFGKAANKNAQDYMKKQGQRSRGERTGPTKQEVAAVALVGATATLAVLAVVGHRKL